MMKQLDTEQPRLEIEAGETQTLVTVRRNFSLWSVFGTAFSLANSWFGISTALVAGINAGGPVQLVYGIIIITVISTAIAICLSELASAMPNAGGQYFWTAQLAPVKYRRFASYLTGWLAWAGSLFTCASISLGVGQLCLGCIRLVHPDTTSSVWATFAAYQVVNLVCAAFNCHSKLLPALTKLSLWISLLSFLVIAIVVPTKASTHQSPRFVFTSFVNNTGWPSDALAFITGLINPNWAFNGLDCATHLAEEVRNPATTVPLATLGTVAIGFVTSWLFALALLFSIRDLALVAATPTGTPVLELFHQALGSSTAGAIALQCLIIATGAGCLVASHTWQARLCWAFARDAGLPWSSRLARVHPVARVPLYAHGCSVAIVALLGFFYVASRAAFNSMVSACVVLLYASYSVPVVFLLLNGGRRNFENKRRGPFWLGKVGLLANCVLLLWTAFTFIMYSFPVEYPVRAGTMNYVCVVYIVVAGAIGLAWQFVAKDNYKPSSLVEVNDEQVAQHEVISNLQNEVSCVVNIPGASVF